MGAEEPELDPAPKYLRQFDFGSGQTSGYWAAGNSPRK
jgi:hypothetical protein